MQIRVSREAYDFLKYIKDKHACKSMDDVITSPLFHMYQKAAGNGMEIAVKEINDTLQRHEVVFEENVKYFPDFIALLRIKDPIKRYHLCSRIMADAAKEMEIRAGEKNIKIDKT